VPLVIAKIWISHYCITHIDNQERRNYHWMHIMWS